jgi:hypothetical protein
MIGQYQLANGVFIFIFIFIGHRNVLQWLKGVAAPEQTEPGEDTNS